MKTHLSVKYARQEPTTDTRCPGKRDTVIYQDPEATRPYARIPWYHRNRPISRNHITLNCHKWSLVWLTA